MYGYVLYAALKCVAYVYISIYRRTPTFSGTPGGVRPTKNRASAAGDQGPAARRHRPAARRRSLLGMDKTELSVNRKQTSRAKPANPHCFVGRMSYNLYLMTFDPKVSATDGLTAIYHNSGDLSSRRPRHARSLSAYHGHMSFTQRRLTMHRLYMSPCLTMLCNTISVMHVIYGIVIYNYMLCYIYQC